MHIHHDHLDTASRQKQMVFLHAFQSIDEETQDESLTVPRKVHYPNFWKDKRDVVHWVNLGHAQDLGLQFWQTKSNAVVVEEKEPPICICRVTSLKGEPILFERASAIWRAVTLKSRKRVEQEKGQDTDENFADAYKNSKGTQSLESEENKKTETEDEQ